MRRPIVTHCTRRSLTVTAFLLGLVLLGWTPAVQAGEPIPVVVTIPVLKELTERIGGPLVHVTSLMTGLESEHTYSPKPSDLVAVRKAKLLVEVGLGLEIWVASLVKNAGSPGLTVVTTSKGVPVIHDAPENAHSATHAGSDHPHQAGNPHIWLDPANMQLMAGQITDALVKVDPAHAAQFQTNRTVYAQELDRVQAELLDRLTRVTDRRLIVHHPAWPYFAQRFGLQIVDTIVLQSGAEPSAHRLHGLIKRIRREGIRVIVSEPQLNQKIPQTLARETGATLIVLTPLPGALPGTETYVDMLRYNVQQLAQALERG
jgi:ABC-type Zn uptake system ZnuABC Zn-binding protein ZnuA